MNSRVERPKLLEIFFVAERRPEIFFYTSNLNKFLQARTVFERYGILLNHFKSKEDPYSEDYTVGKEKLLARAINEILGSIGHASIFFVEDTSLRIDALSDPINDFPGLAVKEWFSKTTFEELDIELKKSGNNRGALIKSDIALHVPGLNRPVFFRGKTRGCVADSPPYFEESRQYPWLTPNSFNGWFITEGSAKRLGEMTFEESWQFDFRIRAMIQLIERLEEYTAALNLPGQAYGRRHRVQTSSQISLFHRRGSALIVVGHTCAGKTTFGECASQKHGYRFIEASSVVRMFRETYDDEKVDPFSLAVKVLESKGPDVVARKILQLFSPELEENIVVTGFRTIEELEVFKKQMPDAKVVLIEASERSRFQRHLQRGRSGSTKDLKEFRQLDSQQWSFGLLRVAEDFADVRIVNEGTLEDYYAQVKATITGVGLEELTGISTNVHPRHDAERSQLYRCLVVLSEGGRPMTCDEIEDVTAQSGKQIRHNNANKVLKRVPELARRLELERTRVRYEILNAGRAYIRLMARLVSQHANTPND